MPTDYNKNGYEKVDSMLVGPNDGYAMVFDDANQFKVVRNPFGASPVEAVTANASGNVSLGGTLTATGGTLTSVTLATPTITGAAADGSSTFKAGTGSQTFKPGGRIFFNNPAKTPINTSSTVYTLDKFQLPANSLPSGASLYIVAAYTGVNATAKIAFLNIGSTAAIDAARSGGTDLTTTTSATGAGGWILQAWVHGTGAATQASMGILQAFTSTTGAIIATPAQDSTGVIHINACGGDATTATDITLNWWAIYLYN